MSKRIIDLFDCPSLSLASSGSIAQVKEIRTVKQIHVVAIDDDDDRGFVNDISGQPQNESVKAASEQSEVFGALSDRILQKHCQFSGDSVKPQCPSLDMEIGISCPVELPSGNGHISHSAPESPCSVCCFPCTFSIFFWLEHEFTFWTNSAERFS